jgi:hypothetical protein
MNKIYVIGNGSWDSHFHFIPNATEKKASIIENKNNS